MSTVPTRAQWLSGASESHRGDKSTAPLNRLPLWDGCTRNFDELYPQSQDVFSGFFWFPFTNFAPPESAKFPEPTGRSVPKLIRARQVQNSRVRKKNL